MLVPLILTVKLSDTAKPVLEKFNVNMANCSECDLLEYACICAH
jgi:DTW domain-containing protein YfiP